MKKFYVIIFLMLMIGTSLSAPDRVHDKDLFLTLNLNRTTTVNNGTYLNNNTGWTTSPTVVFNDTAGILFGLGTSSPRGKLDVRGGVNITGELNASRLNGSLDCSSITNAASNLCTLTSGVASNTGWTSTATTLFNNTAGITLQFGAANLASGFNFVHTGSVNITGSINASRLINANLSNATFPASTCSGTDKVTGITIYGLIICGTDVSGGGSGTYNSTNNLNGNVSIGGQYPLGVTNLTGSPNNTLKITFDNTSYSNLDTRQKADNASIARTDRDNTFSGSVTANSFLGDLSSATFPTSQCTGNNSATSLGANGLIACTDLQTGLRYVNGDPSHTTKTLILIDVRSPIHLNHVGNVLNFSFDSGVVVDSLNGLVGALSISGDTDTINVTSPDTQTVQISAGTQVARKDTINTFTANQFIQGNLNVSGLINATTLINANISNSTFPASTCTGTNKVTGITIYGVVTCAADLQGGGGSYNSTNNLNGNVSIGGQAPLSVTNATGTPNNTIIITFNNASYANLDVRELADNASTARTNTPNTFTANQFIQGNLNVSGLMNVTNLTVNGLTLLNMANLSNFNISDPNYSLYVGGNVNMSGFVNATSYYGNLSNATFPATACSGTNKANGIDIYGKVVCGADQTGGTGGNQSLNTSDSTLFNNANFTGFIRVGTNFPVSGYGVTVTGNVNVSGILNASFIIGNLSNPSASVHGGVYLESCAGTLKVTGIASNGSITCAADIDTAPVTSVNTLTGAVVIRADTQYINLTGNSSDILISGNPSVDLRQKADNLSIIRDNRNGFLTGGLNVTTYVNATEVWASSRFNGSLDCKYLTGGTDANFCADATTGTPITTYNSTQGYDGNVSIGAQAPLSVVNTSGSPNNTLTITFNNASYSNLDTRQRADNLSIVRTDRDNFISGFLNVSSGINTTILQSILNDNNNQSTTDLLILTHSTNDTSNGTQGHGVSILFRGENNQNLILNMTQIIGMYTSTTNLSESTALIFKTRLSGLNLTEVFRIADTTDANGTFRTNGSTFLSTTGGRTGIGTLSPIATLDVRGATNITGTTTLNALTIGSILSCATGLDTSSAGVVSCGTDPTVTTSVNTLTGAVILRGTSMINLTGNSTDVAFSFNNQSLENLDTRERANNLSIVRTDRSNSIVGDLNVSNTINTTLFNAILNDGQNQSAIDMIILTHTTDQISNGTNGLGSSILFRGENNQNLIRNMTRIVSQFDSTTNNSEASSLVFLTTASGKNLTERMRISGLGNVNVTENITGTTFYAGTNALTGLGYAFKDEPNSGIRFVGANDLELDMQGLPSMDWSTTRVRFPNGTASAPGIQFLGHPSGFFTDSISKVLGVSVWNGASTLEVARFTDTGLNVTGNLNATRIQIGGTFSNATCPIIRTNSISNYTLCFNSTGNKFETIGQFSVGTI